jgi:hypothetical protein
VLLSTIGLIVHADVTAKVYIVLTIDYELTGNHQRLSLATLCLIFSRLE